MPVAWIDPVVSVQSQPSRHRPKRHAPFPRRRTARANARLIFLVSRRHFHSPEHFNRVALSALRPMKASTTTVLPLLLLAPAAFAAITTPLRSTRQNTDRLTLLPGPYLTSPAKAPQPQSVFTSADGMVPMSSPPVFAPQPVPRPTPPAVGVRLGVGEAPKTFVPPAPPQPPQNPDALRFDNQLQPTTSGSLVRPSKLQATPPRK